MDGKLIKFILKNYNILLVFILPLLISNCSIICNLCDEYYEEYEEGVTLLNDDGEETDAIDILDNLRVGISGLKANRRYTIQVINPYGRQLTYSRLTADSNGSIAPFTLLFGENLFPCGDYAHTTQNAAAAPLNASRASTNQVEGHLEALQRIIDWASSIRRQQQYYVEVLYQKRIFRRVGFTLKDDGKPKIYVANQHGCLRSGLMQGEDDVYAVGWNFPKASQIRLFGVQDQRIWKEGNLFQDITGANGFSEMETIQLAEDEQNFFVKIWAKEITTTGLYDVIARYTNIEQMQIHARDVISAQNDVGFMIQDDADDPHIEQNMTVPAIDSVLYYLFQDKYFNTDDVWVAINPEDRPGGTGSEAQNARIYVMDHRNEADWDHGDALVDVSSDGFEEVSVKGWCRNQNEIRVWPAPLTNGNYDVIVDFAPFGIYDQGQDIIDELNNAGFQVVDPAALAIVYPVNDLRIFPEKEVPEGLKKDYLYAVVKIDPAAEGTAIYWDSLDIDDPTTDSGPVDPNGASDDDNRGNYGAAPGGPDGDDGFLSGEDVNGIATTSTFSGGIAYVRFFVTSQPGDNFRIRASTSPAFTTFDDSAELTVWRRLHVEIDSMGAPAGTTETGNITNVVNIGGGQSDVTVDIVLDDGSAGSTNGRFENGVMSAAGVNYAVISNTSSTVRVVGLPPIGVGFVLADDDVTPVDVEDPDVGDMVRAFSHAFILPVFDTGEDSSNVAFDLNTEDAEINGQINAGKGTPMSTADYWTVTVHGGFQRRLPSSDIGSGDNDPNDEGTPRARAVDSVQGVFLGNESIRDWIQTPVADGGAGGIDPAPPCAADPGTPRHARRQEILVHEVGHLLSLTHPDGGIVAGTDPCGGVMRTSVSPRESSNFTQQSLSKLRSIEQPD